MLRAGVTTVCDAGAVNEIIFPVRDAINAGILIGPRILASGKVITTEGGHGDQFGRLTSGVEDARQAVSEQVAAGADLIKIMATGGGGEDPGQSLFTLAELQAMKEEARSSRRARGRPLSWHGGYSQLRDCRDSAHRALHLHEPGRLPF